MPTPSFVYDFPRTSLYLVGWRQRALLSHDLLAPAPRSNFILARPLFVRPLTRPWTYITISLVLPARGNVSSNWLCTRCASCSCWPRTARFSSSWRPSFSDDSNEEEEEQETPLALTATAAAAAALTTSALAESERRRATPPRQQWSTREEGHGSTRAQQQRRGTCRWGRRGAPSIASENPRIKQGWTATESPCWLASSGGVVGATRGNGGGRGRRCGSLPRPSCGARRGIPRRRWPTSCWRGRRRSRRRVVDGPLGRPCRGMVARGAAAAATAMGRRPLSVGGKVLGASNR